MKASMAALCEGTAWSCWMPLKDNWLGDTLPTCSGLYRIRLVSKTQCQVAYIGQSGSGLKERIYALRHVYDDTMPYKAPHTAGPSLWAWRHKVPDSFFEVSVAPLPGIPDVQRFGLECLAIALYRQEKGVSPLCQFGRMPEGFAPSSSNNAQLALVGKRYHGGITSQLLDCHIAGVPPQGPLEGDPHARDWGGHHWTPWIPIHSLYPTREEGLYRLRIPDLDTLVFLGQGKLAERLKSVRHLQGMECSWVAHSAWYPQQRYELLTDLISAHILSTATVPLWQFEPSHDGPGGQLLRNVS